ncbi:MAG: holo-ACP synthase [Planctomycetota bacterium]|jgi:holo-[acyl-carrier protein] synthase|nr:holo-ACP synthase [Blastopirellula sp.]
MQLLGIGTDIIECARIAQMIDRHGEHFLKKVFSPSEIEYCGRHKYPAPHYAGRWAAKEALLKALGTGWAKGIQWTDLEILNEPGGEPRVYLRNAAANWATQRGISEFLISISHTEHYAVAFATAVGKPHA